MKCLSVLFLILLAACVPVADGPAANIADELPSETPAEVPEIEAPEPVVETPENIVVVEQEPVPTAIYIDYPYAGDAGLVVREYADFSSPVNSRVAFFQVSALQRDFVLSKKVKFELVPLPQNEDGKLAAQAAWCMWEQGEKQFWAYHDVLHTFFTRLDEKSLVNYVNRIPNSDSGVFEECLSSRKYAPVVEDTILAARLDGITEIPTFMVGTTKMEGEVPYNDLKAEINSQLSKKQNLITGNLVAAINWLLP